MGLVLVLFVVAFVVAVVALFVVLFVALFVVLFVVLFSVLFVALVSCFFPVLMSSSGKDPCSSLYAFKRFFYRFLFNVVSPSFSPLVINYHR